MRTCPCTCTLIVAPEPACSVRLRLHCCAGARPAHLLRICKALLGACCRMAADFAAVWRSGCLACSAGLLVQRQGSWKPELHRLLAGCVRAVRRLGAAHLSADRCEVGACLHAKTAAVSCREALEHTFKPASAKRAPSGLKAQWSVCTRHTQGHIRLACAAASQGAGRRLGEVQSWSAARQPPCTH